MRTLRHKFIAAAAGAVALAAFSGCSDHEEPPVERLDLVSRFFRSVEKGEYEAAAQQGRKIYELDRNNDFMLHLITVHECNIYLLNAQKLLNAGNVNGALRILEDGSRRYPDNRTLGMYHTKLLQLRNAKRLMTAMKNAKGEAAMSASLTAAETGLGTNMSPQLAAYFRSYEEKIKRQAIETEKENRRIEAEKERRRVEMEKRDTLPPPEPVAASPRRKSGAPAATENLDRPPPIAVPEGEK